MNFAEFLLAALKRIANCDFAQDSSHINEDGVYTLELLAIIDNEVGCVATVTEEATDDEIAVFLQKLEHLEKVGIEYAAEAAEREEKIRQILSKLTHQERVLIDRLLPEEMIPDSENDDDVTYE